MGAKGHTGARWPIAVFLAGSAFLAATTCAHVVPGFSADALANYLHLAPFPPLAHPLWSWLVRAVAAVAGPRAPALLNGASVLCGAGALAFLFVLVRSAVRDERMARHLPLAGVVAGLSAAGFLAVSVPFWMVGSRAHPAAFDACVLLGSLCLLARFSRGGSTGFLCAGIVLYAIGMAEVATLLAFAPVVLLHTLYQVLRRGRWSFRTLALIALCLLAWPATVFLAAWDYSRLPVADWRGFANMGEVAWYFLLDQRAALLSSVPRQGWLLLGAGTLVPWLLAMMTLRRAFDGDAGWASLALYAVVTALALATVFGAPFAPWRVLGASPLLVTPYILLAAAFGFMVSRWCGVVIEVAGDRAPRLPIASAVGAASLAVLAIAGFQQRDVVSTKGAADVEALAADMLGHLEGRAFCLTDGLLDSSLRVEAWRRGQAVTWLDVSLADLQSYRRYVAAQFAEPRLQGLAMVGLAPLLMEWLRSDAAVTDRLALGLSPDVWLREGWEPIPAASVYLGLRSAAAGDVMARAARNEAFWSNALPRLARLRDAPPPGPAYADQLARRFSRVANDGGIALENAGEAAAARRAYEAALAFRATNLSAVANLLALGPAPAQRAALQGVLDGALAVGVPRLSDVVADGGHIRTAQAAAWLVGTQQLVSAGATIPADPALEAIVKLYMDGDRAEARRRLERALAEHSDRETYWLLLAGMGYDAGDGEVLRRCFDQMRAMGREWPNLLVLMGRHAWNQGDQESARRFLERAAALRGGDAQLQELLLQLDLSADDLKRAEHRVRRLLSMDPNHVAGNLALARILEFQKRPELAEATLRHVLAQGLQVDALSELAALLEKRDALDEARSLAARAAELNPTSARARAVHGRILGRLDRLAEARESLEAAVKLDGRSVPARLDLAGVLTRLGRFGDAQEQLRAVAESGMSLTDQQRKQWHDLSGLAHASVGPKP